VLKEPIKEGEFYADGNGVKRGPMRPSGVSCFPWWCKETDQIYGEYGSYDCTGSLRDLACHIAELQVVRGAAYAAGYRAGVEAAAKRITASIQMLRNLGMTEGAEVLLAAAEDIRALLNSEADAALQTKGGA